MGRKGKLALGDGRPVLTSVPRHISHKFVEFVEVLLKEHSSSFVAF